ncbi:putative gustatory receptor 28b isoform X2 [Tenebrio molitor]
MGLGYNLNHKLTKLLITCFLILIFCGMTGLEYINCNLFISSVRKYSLVCGVICTTSLTIMMIEEVQFFTYYSLLRNRFKAINDLLRTKFSNTDDTSNRQIHPVTIINCDKEVIMKLRSLHLQLCFVGRSLNEYFNIQILLLIGLSFLGFTTNAYYSFDVISDNFINDGNLIVPAAVFWVAAKFIELLVISVICTITKNEINQTGEILYQLKNRYKKSVATQINLFGKQILHCDFKITALDFFDIDMTLLYGIIGSAATYLTILIQFEIAAKESKRYINVTKN